MPSRHFRAIQLPWMVTSNMETPSCLTVGDDQKYTFRLHADLNMKKKLLMAMTIFYPAMCCKPEVNNELTDGAVVEHIHGEIQLVNL